MTKPSGRRRAGPRYRAAARLPVPAEMAPAVLLVAYYADKPPVAPGWRVYDAARCVGGPYPTFDRAAQLHPGVVRAKYSKEPQ